LGRPARIIAEFAVGWPKYPHGSQTPLFPEEEIAFADAYDPSIVEVVPVSVGLLQ